MSDAAADEPWTPRTLGEVADAAADYRRRNGVEELSEDEAMALAVESTREARAELRAEGIY